MSDVVTPHRPLSLGMRLLIVGLLAKLAWDVWTLVTTYPNFSWPKLGIAMAVPVLVAGLLRRQNWALNLTGVLGMFWLVFVVARLIGPVFSVEPVTTPFPWSNLISLPVLGYVLNNLRSDAEVARDRAAAGQ
ncbi:MAG: hypothetical protein KDC87_16780 [Planctomycetes bacterium]|nr:hypothetical protein [Planctomycetota bacterium]